MVIIKTPKRMTYLLMLTVSQTFRHHFAAPWWLIVEGIVAGLVISMIVHCQVGDPA